MPARARRLDAPPRQHDDTMPPPRCSLVAMGRCERKDCRHAQPLRDHRHWRLDATKISPAARSCSTSWPSINLRPQRICAALCPFSAAARKSCAARNGSRSRPAPSPSTPPTDSSRNLILPRRPDRAARRLAARYSYPFRAATVTARNRADLADIRPQPNAHTIDVLHPGYEWIPDRESEHSQATPDLPRNRTSPPCGTISQLT